MIKKNIPGFKLYVEYIYSVDSAVERMNKIEKSSKKAAEIIRKYLDEKEKKAVQELMQPTFRIARYEALFEDIIKKTEKSHPDYKKMKEALLQFKNNLTQVNATVDKTLRQNKLNLLEQ